MRNYEIIKDLDIFTFKDKIESYRDSWIEYVQRMPEEVIIKKI
jgi:hypothetical protein